MYTDACPAQKNLKSFGFDISKFKVLMKQEISEICSFQALRAPCNP
jgi:hypothetical protein